MEPRFDINGRDITKPIPPMTIEDWEDFQIRAEFPSVGIFDESRSVKEEAMELAKYVMRMSAEIRRLRLTYGEDVWTAVYHSAEEDEIIRQAHEAERGKYQIKKTTGV